MKEEKTYKKNPELRQKIEALAKIPTRTKADMLTRSSLHSYIMKVKEQVFEAEKINDRCLILQYREGKIWNLGNNSALIYYYHVIRILKIEARLRNDTDYNKHKWLDGVVSINNIDKTTVLLKNILECKLVVNTPEIKVFVLPSPVEKTTLEVWKHSREEKHRRFNEQNMPKVAYPHIHEYAVDLQVKVVNRLKRLSPICYNAYGHKGAEITEWLVMNVISVMNGRMDSKEYFDGALEQLGYFTDWLVMVDRFELFNVESIAQVSEVKDKLVNEINMQIKIDAEKERVKLERKARKEAKKDGG